MLTRAINERGMISTEELTSVVVKKEVLYVDAVGN